jgi:hypothetical protein
VLGSIFESVLWSVLVPILLGAIVLALSWVFLYGAAVARRRIRLSTDRPVRALWDAIGSCGEAPRDHSLGFALIAIALLIVAWLAVPVVIWLIFG